MSDLLAADFTRLMKSMVFKGIFLFSVECLIFEIVFYCKGNNFSKEFMDSLLNTNFIVFGILISVFIGLFVGSDYSDGTMRNKLVAGNSRTAVYLSNLIVCIVAGAILQAVNFIIISVVSFVVFGPYTPFVSPYVKNAEEIAKQLVKKHFLMIAEKQVIGLYIIIVYTAVFLLIAMLICSKSGATVTVMAAAVIIFAVGMTVSYRVSDYDPNTEEQTAQVQTIDQPQFNSFGNRNKKLSGVNLKIHLFLDEFLPSSQAQNLTKKTVPQNSKRYVMYDLGVAAVTTACGIFMFNKKDLK